MGHEIFNINRISFECLRSISEILKEYARVMKEYGVKNYRTITSTFFKEAQNYEYVVDQIKVGNGMKLEILEDGYEKSLIYWNMIKHLKKEEKVNKNILIVYVGASSIGISICADENIVFSQNLKIGSLKLHDMLGQVQDQTIDFGVVLEEYLNRVLGRVDLPMKKDKIDKLIIAGSQIDLVEKFCSSSLKNNIVTIESEKLYEFYDSIKKMTGELISEKYEISLQEAEVFFTTMTIYQRVLKMTNLKNVISMRAELWDGMMLQILYDKNRTDFEKSILKNAISCAKAMADHYNCDLNHREATYDYATLIFDKLRKIHGLDEKKKLLLEVAIILHEVGYFVNSKFPRISTFDIIKNLEVYGLTYREVKMIANISKYDEFTVPSVMDEDYAKLEAQDKLSVSKMVAIFRLANALDKSKLQKFKSINVKLTNENLIISTQSDKNTYLERWAFNKCVPFFEEVFGVSPQLVIKTSLFEI
ncbi:MAG: phosphatase [Clostridia bacterium]|nr:phosphatase [Clostridia bacterium]